MERVVIKQSSADGGTAAKYHEAKNLRRIIHRGQTHSRSNPYRPSRDAECTVWTHGVFKLSTAFLDDLMRLVGDSDFGIFVFSPDDTVEIRGKLFSAPRDNVVYELGLFSGELGRDRCFFVTPLAGDVHIPSDLLGITPGEYDAGRSDKNWEAAVGPFCTKVRKAIEEKGLRDTVNQGLRDLIIQYECCDWIEMTGFGRSKSRAADCETEGGEENGCLQGNAFLLSFKPD